MEEKVTVDTNKPTVELNVGSVSSLPEMRVGRMLAREGTRWVRTKARCEAGQSK